MIWSAAQSGGADLVGLLLFRSGQVSVATLLLFFTVGLGYSLPLLRLFRLGIMLTGAGWPHPGQGGAALTRSDDHRLADIRDAAAEPAARIGTGYEAWVADEDLRLVTERLVEIIGEAARAMTSQGRAQYPEVDWTGLIGLRNVLVHAYHRIQPGNASRSRPRRPGVCHPVRARLADQSRSTTVATARP